MTDRPRKPALAAFLTLLAPGLGQIYNGEWAKALVLLSVTIPLVIAVVLLLFSPWFHFVLPLAIVAGQGLWAYAMFDAVKTAGRFSASYELKPFNRVLVYVAIVLAFGITRGLFTEFLRSTFVQAFRVPSEAMMPTLVPGDYVFADRRPSARTPRRGDLVVCANPEKPRAQFIKRVVGTAGDRIEIRDKTLFVNGHAQAENYVIHIDPATHQGPRDNMDAYVVPHGSYFVLGDNRDNSLDSRFFGPIEHIDGKLRGIYWSWDPQRHAARWERVGRLLE